MGDIEFFVNLKLDMLEISKRLDKLEEKMYKHEAEAKQELKNTKVRLSHLERVNGCEVNGN